MALPLYEAKADLFRTLGHPVRVRVLELLSQQPMPARDLLAQIEVESSNLSQQLSVLRRSGLVTSTRQGTTVVYAVTSPHVGAMLATGREILASVLGDSAGLLAELRESS